MTAARSARARATTCAARGGAADKSGAEESSPRRCVGRDDRLSRRQVAAVAATGAETAAAVATVLRELVATAKLRTAVVESEQPLPSRVPSSSCALL